MSSPLLPEWAAIAKPVIGMLHLRPLPGSPRFAGSVEHIRAALVRDAQALVDGGIHGLLLENFGDAPFYPRRVPARTVAHMTALAAEVRRRFDVPLGINVLRNDGRSALAIAHAVGAAFIRVNVLCGARVTDQGLVQGVAHQLLRDRARLGATSIKILADVNVKHSAPLASRPLEEEVSDTLDRGGADALIVSGPRTGQVPDLREVQTARDAAGAHPLFIGSGVSADTLASYWPLADGFIVGTALKHDAQTTNAVDPTRVSSLLRIAAELAGAGSNATPTG